MQTDHLLAALTPDHSGPVRVRDISIGAGIATPEDLNILTPIVTSVLEEPSFLTHWRITKVDTIYHAAATNMFP